MLKAGGARGNRVKPATRRRDLGSQVERTGLDGRRNIVLAVETVLHRFRNGEMTTGEARRALTDIYAGAFEMACVYALASDNQLFFSGQSGWQEAPAR